MYIDSKYIKILLLSLILTLMHREGASAQFQRLDSLIRVQPEITKRHEQHIQQMKDRLAATQSPREQFDELHDIYEAYASFKFDSAYVYVQKEIELAQILGDSVLVNQGRLDMIHALSGAAVFPLAEEVLKQVNHSTLTLEQSGVLARLEIELYINLAEYTQGTRFSDLYVSKLMECRRRILKELEPNGLSYMLTYAEILSDDGKYNEAIKLLENQLKRYSSGDRMYSIITNTISFYYTCLQDKENTKRYLILSAASDIEGSVRENTSMRILSSLLFDEGDVTRAYTYLNFSLDDALFFGTRLRNIQASTLMPKIMAANNTLEKKAKDNMMMLLVILSVIAIIMAMAIAGFAITHRRYRDATSKLQAANEELNVTNKELTQNHEQMKVTNSMLKEREAVKEEYIGRFLAISSQFIDRIDEYRKQLLRLHREHKAQEIAAMLKSSSMTDEQSKLFYDNFDEAFLNIFPDFCEKVNELLQPDGRIELHNSGSLTTELRILALLRLGITSNQLIASILRSGLSTIYTYRSRLKARALDHDNFEKLVKEIA